MSGPDLPRGAGVGSGAVGTFVVGVSPVGTGRPFDAWKTVISQYGNSDTLTKLILNFQDAVDQTDNFENFFDLVINVLTAQGHGLDVWARIVAVNRVLTISGGLKWFGFDEGGTLDYDPWRGEAGGQSPFYGGQKLTQNFLLTDDGFRVLILAKAFSNICDGSIPAINRLLMTLFGSSGKCYVIDNLNMTMVYRFEFQPSPVQLAILTQSGVFPKPLGVTYSILYP